MNTSSLKKFNNKIIAALCSGIAEYFGWQTKLVRTLFVFATLLGVSALHIIYRFNLGNA